MKNPYLVSNAGAALDTLSRWEQAELQNEAIRQAAAFDTQVAKVTIIEADPRWARLYGGEQPTDFLAQVHHHAVEVILQHRRHFDRNQGCRDTHLEAIAAWLLVRRAKDRDTLERRIREAIGVTAKLFPRAGRILK